MDKLMNFLNQGIEKHDFKIKIIAIFVVSLVLPWVVSMLFGSSGSLNSILFLIFGQIVPLCLFLYSIGLHIKRLVKLKASKWYAALCVVPIINLIFTGALIFASDETVKKALK